MEENKTTTPETTENHGTVTGAVFQIWVEIFNFFKYIFYDVFLGK